MGDGLASQAPSRREIARLSRLTPLDKALVLILVPLWIVCFGLGVKTQIQGGGIAFIGLSLADSRSYPLLNGQFNRGHFSNPLEQAGLRAGDRLLRLGQVDLRGVGTASFTLHSFEQSQGSDRVALLYERGGERRSTSLPLMPIARVRPWLATSLAYAMSALFLLLRATPTPTVRAYFHAGFALAFSFCPFMSSWWEALAGFSTMLLAQTVVFPLLMRFLFLFPDAREPEARWSRVWPWFLGVIGPLWVITMWTGLWTVGDRAYYGTMFLGAVAILAVVTRNYRRGDAIARRQIRWVAFGQYCVLLPLVVATGLMVFDPRFMELWFLSFWAVPLVPISLHISVARFNLFDVDRLLSGAISYTVLVILLAIGAEVLLEPLAGRAAAVLGIAPATGQVVFVALLAAVLIPAQRTWRPYVDRVFFAEGRSREQEVEALLGQLVQTDSRSAVVELTGAGIGRVFRPEFCAIYERAGEQFEPSYAAGATEFPVIPAASEVIRALEIKVSPILLDTRGTSEAPAGLRAPPVPGAAAIVPLRPGGALLAFIAIGPKQSGDVYPSTDLSLLATLGHTVSASMERLSHTPVG